MSSTSVRIAVLTDIHANLPALQAALGAVRASGYDLLYSTGDVIGIGPHPAECLDLLLSMPNARFIMGNHDAWFAHGIPDPLLAGFGPGELEHHRWVHSSLDPALRPTVAEWPWTAMEEVGGLRIVFTHYGLSSSGRDFVPVSSGQAAEDFDDLFSNLSADIIFFGHDHRTADVAGRARYVNSGSLGCHDKAVVRFALLDIRPDGSRDLTHLAVPYDDTLLLRDFDERRVPDREQIWRVFFGGRTPG